MDVSSGGSGSHGLYRTGATSRAQDDPARAEGSRRELIRSSSSARAPSRRVVPCMCHPITMESRPMYRHAPTPLLTGAVLASAVLVSLLRRPAAAQWAPQTRAAPPNILSAVWFTSSQIGWAVGDAGTSIFTINGGEHVEPCTT